MAEDWTTDEIVAATRAYMWMWRSKNDGYNPVKSRVNAAMVAGPLNTRNKLDYSFQNISSVLEEMGLEWLDGFPPRAHVDPKSTALIKDAVEAYLNGPKSTKRVSALVQALSPEIVRKAILDLAGGADFSFPDSTAYDVVTHDGLRLAPKRVIGYAALLHYGAPLLSVDFAGGLGSFAFGRLEAAGFRPTAKLEILGSKEAVVSPDVSNYDEFQIAVEEKKRRGFTQPPSGHVAPRKVLTTSYSYQREPEIVAFVELRAKGLCELCGKNAPFVRRNGEKFLEVHHIHPLSKGGADAVDNAAALCPNCHRECHHGAEAAAIQLHLLTQFNSYGG